MKKQKNIIVATVVLVIIFIGVVALTFIKSDDWIQQGFLKSEGNAAQNFAVLASQDLHISDKRFEELKKCSYEECLNSEENKQLKRMLSGDKFTNKVDYAYIMVKIPDNEVKYKVTKDNKNKFNAPIGTKLDIMFLLDVNTDNVSESNEKDDIERYSYYIKEDAEILGNKPMYIYNKSEWGEHICGYTPIYTNEGNYIGALAVELQTTDYNSYRNSAMMAMGGLILVLTLTLAIIFIYLYRKYSKVQFERIHLDALTQIYNRSYYNNYFIKKLNKSKPHSSNFALMIADVDFFKKVNDTFGHEVGDQVLIQIAEKIIEVFGKNHVVRFGGEEFVIGIWYKNDVELQGMINKLFDNIRNFKFTSQQIEVTISLGCSVAECDQIDGWLVSNMLKMADNNLYHIKENGRNNHRIDQIDLKQVEDSKKE